MVLAMVPKAKPAVGALSSYSSVTVDIGAERWARTVEQIASSRRARPTGEAAPGQADAVFETASAFLPDAALEALRALPRPEGPPCVLLRGLPPGIGQEAQEAILLSAVGELGAAPFTYRGLCGERLVRSGEQDVAHEPGWHRDGRSSPPFDAPRRHYRPEEFVADYCATLCLGADGPAAVRVSDFRAMYEASSAEDMELLKRTPLAFFDVHAGQWLEPAPVVQATGPAPSPPIVDLRCRARYEPEGDPEAVLAYQRLHEVAEDVSERVLLQAGDILVVSNKRCLHAWEGDDDGTARPRALWRSTFASRAASSWPSRVVQ